MGKIKRQNICREITFYNNFVPTMQQNGKRKDWEYFSFGAIDGVDVSENIAVNNKAISECIWERKRKFCQELSGIYDAEQVYAMRYCDSKSEEEFWKDDSEYPFFFFQRIQCTAKKTSLLKRIDELQSILQIDNQIKAMLYLTYDNSDVLVVLRSKLYEYGAGLVSTLYRVWNGLTEGNVCSIKSSFTIFAVKHAWISKMTPQNIQNLKETQIKEVLVQVIEKYSGSISSAKQEKALADVSTFPVLGTSDEMISIVDNNWYDFLRLYEREQGILCTLNEVGAQYFSGVKTIIRTEVENYDHIIASQLERVLHGIEVQADFKPKYLDKVKDLTEKSKAPELDGNKELQIIMNALPKFGSDIFNDYIFFSMLKPLDNMLELMKIWESKNGSKGDFYEFLKGFSMYTQGAAGANIDSMQGTSFNTQIYDVPSKLVAFYSALIYFATKIINDCQELEGNQKPVYDFIIIPGVTDRVNVIELYRWTSGAKRLMRVEIPERSFYNIHDMMIILVHEVAHYVGRTIRNRKERFEAIISSYAHVYAEYLKSTVDIKISLEKWRIVEKRLAIMLKDALARELDEEYIKEYGTRELGEASYKAIRDRNDSYQWHFAKFMADIPRAMYDVFQFGFQQIFTPVLRNMEIKEKEDFLEQCRLFSERFMNKRGQGTTLTTSYTTLSVLHSLYEESFADLISIMILGVSVRDYIASVYKEIQQQGMSKEEFIASEAMYRISLVLLCILDGKINDITPKSFFDSFKDTEEDQIYKEIAEMALRIWDDVEGSSEKEDESYEQDILAVLRDVDVFNKSYNYLISCYNAFSKRLKQYDEAKKLKDCFLKCVGSNNSSIEEQLCIMNELIEQYRKEVLV